MWSLRMVGRSRVRLSICGVRSRWSVKARADGCCPRRVMCWRRSFVTRPRGVSPVVRRPTRSCTAMSL